VAVEALFDSDGWGGPEEEPRVSQVWEAIEAVVSRADLRAALTVVSETVPPPGAEDPDDWRTELLGRYERFLIAKAVFVAVAAVLALASLVRLRHPAEAGAGLPLATRLEIGALAMVLVVTGLLTVLTPPAKPIYPGQARGAPATAVHTGRRPPGEAASFTHPAQFRAQ
jgi:hypothetical protein